MITSAKHEGYISVWARVRSTRVPNTIHHKGRGCKRYKDERGPSGAVPINFRAITTLIQSLEIT